MNRTTFKRMIKRIVGATQGGAGGGRRWVEMCDKSDMVMWKVWEPLELTLGFKSLLEQGVPMLMKEACYSPKLC